MKGFIGCWGLRFVKQYKPDKEQYKLIRSLVTLHDQFLNIVQTNTGAQLTNVLTGRLRRFSNTCIWPVKCWNTSCAGELPVF